MAEKNQKKGMEAIEGIFSGLGNILDKLGELAEKGEEMKKSGEFTVDTGSPGEERKMRGVYGFNIRTGIGERGEEQVKVEPFGNVKRDEETGEAVIQEVREPLIDLFDEEDGLNIIVEMPGVGEEDIKLELHGDVLMLTAERGDKKYRKEVLLPRSYPEASMSISVNNGVVEISFQHQ